MGARGKTGLGTTVNIRALNRSSGFVPVADVTRVQWWSSDEGGPRMEIEAEFAPEDAGQQLLLEANLPVAIEIAYCGCNCREHGFAATRPAGGMAILPTEPMKRVYRLALIGDLQAEAH